jgi:hypothetical protein
MSQWTFDVDSLKYGGCKIGNALQYIADGGYDLGFGIQAVGAVGALGGFAAVGPPGAVPGVVAMGFGGATSWISSGVQFAGGVLQYGGDSSAAKSNMLAGGVSAATGGLMHSIGGSLLRSGTNYVARAHNSAMQLRSGFAGAGVDTVSSAVSGFKPLRADCN